eukprot:COSAG05_NODE_4983_length_1302_cov_2.063175_2_plen_156_part_00
MSARARPTTHLRAVMSSRSRSCPCTVRLTAPLSWFPHPLPLRLSVDLSTRIEPQWQPISMRSTMCAEIIGHLKPCMTDIYLHTDARMADYIRTHPYLCLSRSIVLVPSFSLSLFCVVVVGCRDLRRFLSWACLLGVCRKQEYVGKGRRHTALQPT